MTTGHWIISCALPCTKVSPSSIESYQHCAYLILSFQCFSILTLNIRFVPLTLAAFRDQLKNSLSKVIISMASAGPIMRTKSSEDRYSKQANKVPSIMLVYRQKCRDSVLQYIKDAWVTFPQNFGCFSTITCKLRLCGLWIEINILHYLGWHRHGQLYVVLFIPTLM
jgi:hypothetical protein